jgi:hypothetical protein
MSDQHTLASYEGVVSSSSPPPSHSSFDAQYTRALSRLPAWLERFISLVYTQRLEHSHFRLKLAEYLPLSAFEPLLRSHLFYFGRAFDLESFRTWFDALPLTHLGVSWISVSPTQLTVYARNVDLTDQFK